MALSVEHREQLLGTLKARFEKHMNRHHGLEWTRVLDRLEANSEKLRALYEMENTGGEPDVVSHDKKTGEYIFYDCAPESPDGRRSLCYDRQALDARKENKPKSSALDMAADIGIELLTEEQYRALQKLGSFDTKTSSWVKTPPDIRELGGAIFATTPSSSTTTARPPTTPPEAFVARSAYSLPRIDGAKNLRDCNNCRAAVFTVFSPSIDRYLSEESGFEKHR